MIVSLTCDDLLFLYYQEVYRRKEEEMLKTLLCEYAKPPLPGSRRSRCCGDASTGAPRRSGERREAIPTRYAVVWRRGQTWVGAKVHLGTNQEAYDAECATCV